MARAFLLIAGTIFLLIVALPLFLAPLAWAKRFLWTLPEEHALTIYFGRCLGATGIAVAGLALRAAADPAAHLEVFDLIAISGALLTVVHVWGAIRRIQPWIETVEIGLYLAATVASVWLRLTLG
ncbi:MAG: hypothetical protein E6J90_31990 [Deltaproteobacteria bacterium]|nr:MAG: hypothetical protein E6J91_26260 [Deltaproteobacteria bacterium]TMQ12292.1 MAG: hypothetical protein E6J90_31990 [Deltaproteobacteria bacterium]